MRRVSDFSKPMAHLITNEKLIRMVSMEEENKKIEDVLEAIHKFMQNVQNFKEPIKMTPEILKQMQDLKKFIHSFSEYFDELSEVFGINIDNLEKEVEISSKDHFKSRQLIQRTKDNEKEALATIIGLTKAKNRRKIQQTGKKGNLPNVKEQKERRKLFKSIGGDKKWIPL